MKRYFNYIFIGIIIFISFLTAGISKDVYAEMNVFYRNMDHNLQFNGNTVPGLILSKPVVQLDRSGYGLHVFAIGQNHEMLKLNSLGNGWTSPVSGSLQYIDRLAVGMEQDRRLHAFTRGKNGMLYHAWEMTPEGSWSGYAQLGIWDALSQTHKSDATWVESFVVSQNSDGRLEIFGIGENNDLIHKWELSANSNQWSAWASLGGQIDQLEVVRNSVDGLQVFARWKDHSVRYVRQGTPGGTWSAWNSLGGGVESFKVLKNAGGHLEVFGIGANRALFYKMELGGIFPPNTWDIWRSLGGIIDTLAVERYTYTNTGEHLVVYARGMNSGIYYIEKINGTWSSWKSTPSPIIDDNTLVVAEDNMYIN